MRLFLALSALVLVVAACSDAGNKSKADSRSKVSAPSTSPSAAPASFSAPRAGYFTAGDPPATPQPLAGSAGALGSGCAPGAGALPDGVWFGHAVRWDASGIDFDLACFYVGEAAAREAAARHEEEPPNDFFIVNDKKSVRRVEVAPNAVGYRLVDRGGIVLERVSFAELIKNSGTYEPCPAEWCPVWLFINSGAANEVMQQYVP